MALLAPLFLLALASLALPVWLHRLETASADRRPFASAMLLEAAERRVHVRRRIRYWALLALRLLLLAAIVFAFAKPALERAAVPAAATAGSWLVVVDTSASMQRGDAFADAITRADEILNRAPDGALLQVFEAGGALRATGEAALDRRTAAAALQSLSARSTRLDYGNLMSAVDRVAAGLPAPVVVHVVSDFQASGLPPRFADLATSNVDRLMLEAVRREPGATRGIVALDAGGDAAELSIAAEAPLELTVEIGDQRETLSVAAGQQRVSLPLPALEPGDHALSVRLSGRDEFAVDDERYTVVERVAPTPVPVIVRNPDSLPATYLDAALVAAGDGYAALPLVAGDFDPRVLSRYRFAIVADLGIVDATLANALNDYLQSGGRLLAFAGRRSEASDVLPVAGLNVAPASLTESEARLAVGPVDAAHPALEALAGWSAVRFSSVLPAEPRNVDDVLMALESGAPLLLERRAGAGRLVTLLAGLDNTTNDLPVQPVFVGFIAEMARYLGGATAYRRDYAVGESFVLPAGGGQVVGPDGQERLTLNETRQTASVLLDQAGVYSVYTDEGEFKIAANPDARELQTERLDDLILGDWSALATRRQAADGTVDVADGSGTIGLWPWLLALAALALLGESLLANLFFEPAGRRPREASA